jgi:hypothetical protein
VEQRFQKECQTVFSIRFYRCMMVDPLRQSDTYNTQNSCSFFSYLTNDQTCVLRVWIGYSRRRSRCPTVRRSKHWRLCRGVCRVCCRSKTYNDGPECGMAARQMKCTNCRSIAWPAQVPTRQYRYCTPTRGQPVGLRKVLFTTVLSRDDFRLVMLC